MIRPRFGSRVFSRRAFERISIIVIEPVSSTQIGAFISLSHADVSRGQSSCVELAGAQALRLDLRLAAHQPLRHLALRHLEREERDRNVVRGRRGSAAMLSASADFPIDGRAAMMIRLPGWKPDVSLSSSLKPVGRPSRDAGLVEVHDPLEALLQQPLDVAEVAG